MKKIVLVLLGIGLGIGLIFAEEKKEKNIVKSTEKEITGEVSAISKNFIAIVYQRDEEKGIEYEMAFTLDENIELKNKKRIEEINVGDIVKLTYEENIEESALGERKVNKAKVVEFLKPALKKPKVLEPEGETLITE